MDASPHHSAVKGGGMPAGHWVAGVLSVVLSVLLHIALITQLPPVGVGRVPALDDTARVRPVVLGAVHPELPALERPDRFRVEDPDSLRQAALTPDALREALEEWLPVREADLGERLAGEELAVAEPVAGELPDPWDPRSELLHIRDRLVPDEISALPRRLVPDTARADGGPDIVRPVERPGLALAQQGEGWFRVEAVERTTPADPGRGLDPLDPLDGLDALDAVRDESDVVPIEDLLLAEVRTYQDPAEQEHIYFEIRIRGSAEAEFQVLPRDVLLIQDASLSMTQPAIDLAKEGMHRWLASLRGGDRFEIMAFRDDTTRAFGEWTPVNPVTRSSGAYFIESLRAVGRTDVFASLERLLELETSTERAAIAIMISDGVPTTGVIDNSEILLRFSAANAGRISVFAAGGGPRANHYFLQFLGYENRGDARVTANRSDLPDSLGQLAGELSRPVLAQLRYYLAGADGVEVYPRRLTNLYLDRPLLVYGRMPAGSPSAVVHVVGYAGRAMQDMVFEFDFAEAGAAEPGIRLEWARQKSYHLVGEHIRTQDPALLDQLEAMHETYGLTVLYGLEAMPPIFRQRFLPVPGTRSGERREGI